MFQSNIWQGLLGSQSVTNFLTGDNRIFPDICLKNYERADLRFPGKLPRVQTEFVLINPYPTLPTALKR
jgi:hypothetical protein